MDVSHMDKKGEGFEIVANSNIPDTYFVAKDIELMSDNYEGFENAINLIQNGPKKFENDLRLARFFFLKQYVDVSNLNKHGEGDIIDEADITDQYVALNLPMVSDNYENFERAINLIKNGPELYKEDLELAREYFS
jgi:hypothetical protein